MKLNEFEKELRKLGYDVDSDYKDVTILKGSHIVGTVSNKTPFSLNTLYGGFDDRVSTKKQDQLLSVMLEYARTPIEHRECGEQRVYVKVPHTWNQGEYFYKGTNNLEHKDTLDRSDSNFLFTSAEIERYELNKFNTIPKYEN